MIAYRRVFTTAPIDYDYGYTHESKHTGTFDKGSGVLVTVREVFIESDRVDYQIGRYQSGLYGTWTEDQAKIEQQYPYLKL